MTDGIRHLLEYTSKQRAIGREATSAELHSIAEVIDCEMRSLKDERDHWMELAHQWEAGASTRGFAERLEAAASERADVTLFGVDYTPLELVKELTDERDLLKTQWEAGVDFDQRLEACADKREDVTLFGVDYTPLPVDADGVPIHVGDVMEWPYCNGEFEVIGIGGNTLFYIDKDSNECEWTAAGDKRHHHAPTVEDVLREFGKRWDDPAHYAKGELVETFAAKLRLAGEE